MAKTIEQMRAEFATQEAAAKKDDDADGKLIEKAKKTAESLIKDGKAVEKTMEKEKD